MRRGNTMRSQGASLLWPSPLSSCSLRPCPQVPLRQPNLVDSRLHFRFMEAMALRPQSKPSLEQIQIFAYKGVLYSPVSEKVIYTAPASTF